MKFAVTTFATQPELSPEETIPRLGELGYDGIEIWGRQLDGLDDDGVRSLRARAEKHGLIICAISPYFDFVQGPERWGCSLKDSRTICHQARLVGATIIRYREVDFIPSKDMTQAQWIDCLHGLRALCGLAAPNLAVGIECHVDLPQDSVENILMMIDRVAAPNLQVIFQPDMYPPAEVPEAFEALYPYTAHVHVGNVQQGGATDENGFPLRTNLGDPEGEYDFDWLLNELDRKNYEGFVTVEALTPPKGESLGIELEFLRKTVGPS